VAAAMFGVLAMAVPAGPGRRLALPGVFVLGELWRWSWPFGGVPLATIPMGQVDSPLAPVVRTLGSLLLVALVVAVGVAISALAERSWRPVAAVAAVVALALGWAAVAPDGHAVRSLDIAAVQGGGQQRTRANPEMNPVVLQRHLDATELVSTPVDLVLWPENVVNPLAPGELVRPGSRYLSFDEATEKVRALAQRLDATLLPGWFHPIDDRHTVNYTEVITADGLVVDRYDKVRTVPFGEFVPLRWLIEPFAGDVLPQREVRPGTGPAVLDTPEGRVGISISWEIFFDTRARDAARNGATVLLNPTNGSSYWLTIVQTQQIASSKLRALETGRWVVQAAPTGFTAIVDPTGRVQGRTAISEQGVVQGTIELREGKTIAVRVGSWPMVLVALGLLAAANLWARRVTQPSDLLVSARRSGADRGRGSDLDEDGDRSVVDELDEHVGAEAPAGHVGPQRT
jgi:apolipoprotein N-acyltransferase